MRKIGSVLLLVCALAAVLQAQETDLQALHVEVETQTDAFGIEQQVLVGDLFNNGEMAYDDITVYADVLDEEGTVIGEGFGFVVDACGVPLDVPLQPGQSRRFVLSLEIFGAGDIADFEVVPEGRAVQPEEPLTVTSEAITRVSTQEVVRVEWEDEQTLRYGVGCAGELFTEYNWFQYDLESETRSELPANPNESFITEAFIQQTGITLNSQSFEREAIYLERSFLTFPTQSSRIVFQNDLNTVITAEVDGSFKRVIHQRLARYSLQGFVWSPLGNFVAYYFGAYGEPVRYFTASAQNGLISALLENNTPSMTVPGLTDDARRVIISGTFPDENGEEVTGYYLSSVITQQLELLFAVDELPGNNYPAPVYYRAAANTRYIYVVRPVEDEVLLQCYFREGEELSTLDALPLQLTPGERAWAWLSPDANTLALGADGAHGGLWLIDLSAYDVCR